MASSYLNVILSGLRKLISNPALLKVEDESQKEFQYILPGSSSNCFLQLPDSQGECRQARVSKPFFTFLTPGFTNPTYAIIRGLSCMQNFLPATGNFSGVHCWYQVSSIKGGKIWIASLDSGYGMVVRDGDRYGMVVWDGGTRWW